MSRAMNIRMADHLSQGERARMGGTSLIAAFFFLLLASSIYGANKNAGTGAAPFLKIGGGARPAGMGNAFTAGADDVNAVAWNPAGLGGLPQAQFTALHSQWFQSSNFEFVAAAYPTSIGTFGIGFRSLVVDAIDRRAGDTDVADGTFESNDSAYTLSYGKKLSDTFAVGVNATYVKQKLDTQSASAVAGDVGLQWQTPHDPLKLGLAVRHVGTQPKFVDESDPLPMTTAVGAQYRLFRDQLRLSADLSSPRDNKIQYAGGVELTRPLTQDLSGSLRAGYASVSTDVTDGTSGLTMGLGLSFRGLGFDAAWVPYGNLGNTFHYAFLVKF